MLFNNILRGGGRFDLKGESRISYLWRCNQITCKSKTIKEYEDSIQENLETLFDIVGKVINESTASNKTEYLEYLGKIILDKQPFTIKTLNLKSLQCVILMTLLLIETEKITDDDLMATYNSSFKIKDLFKKLTENNLFIDFNELEKVCVADLILRNLVKLFKLPGIDEIADDLVPNSTEYSNENMKHVRLAVLLGELSLEEIIESELKFIHLVGITTAMEWADGRLYTPFEFFHHDLVHAFNIMGMESNDTTDKLNDLYQYIKSNKEKLGKNYYNIIVILFLIIHESARPYILLNHPNPTMNEVAGGSGFIKNLDNWMNPYFYGGLLPEEIKNQREKIMPYLNTSINELMKLLREIQSAKSNVSQTHECFYTKYIKYKTKYHKLKLKHL